MGDGIGGATPGGTATRRAMLGDGADILLRPASADELVRDDVVRLGPHLTLLANASPVDAWLSAAANRRGDSQSQTLVVLGRGSASTRVRELVQAWCETTSSELAGRAADAHELLCAFTCEPDEHAPPASLATQRSMAVQQWSVSLDDTGRVCGVHVELPLVEHGRSGLRSLAASLFAPLTSDLSSRDKQQLRDRQSAGRDALHTLMRQLGMAPVEEEHALNVVIAAVRLCETRFYPGSGGGRTPLLPQSEGAAKALKAAATLLGIDEAALREAVGSGSADAAAAERVCIELAHDLMLRLIRWLVQHINLSLRLGVKRAAADATSTAAVRVVRVLDASGDDDFCVSHSEAPTDGLAGLDVLLRQAWRERLMRVLNELAGGADDAAASAPPKLEAIGSGEWRIVDGTDEEAPGAATRALQLLAPLAAGEAEAREAAAAALTAAFPPPTSPPPPSSKRTPAVPPRTAFVLPAPQHASSQAYVWYDGAADGSVVGAATRLGLRSESGEKAIALLSKRSSKRFVCAMFEAERPTATAAPAAAPPRAARAALEKPPSTDAANRIRQRGRPPSRQRSPELKRSNAPPVPPAAGRSTTSSPLPVMPACVPWLHPSDGLASRVACLSAVVDRLDAALVAGATPCFAIGLPRASASGPHWFRSERATQIAALGLPSLAARMREGTPYRTSAFAWFASFGCVLSDAAGVDGEAEALRNMPQLLAALNVPMDQLQVAAAGLGRPVPLAVWLQGDGGVGSAAPAPFLVAGTRAVRLACLAVRTMKGAAATVQLHARGSLLPRRAELRAEEAVARVRRQAAAHVVQAGWRTALRAKERAVSKLQAAQRGRQARGDAKAYRAARCVQSAHRARGARQLAGSLRAERREAIAAYIISRTVRASVPRRRYLKLHRAAVLIQRPTRRLLARLDSAEARAARETFRRQYLHAKQRLAEIEAQMGQSGLSDAQMVGLRRRAAEQRYQLRVLQVGMLERQRKGGITPRWIPPGEGETDATTAAGGAGGVRSSTPIPRSLGGERDGGLNSPGKDAALEAASRAARRAMGASALATPPVGNGAAERSIGQATPGWVVDVSPSRFELIEASDLRPVGRGGLALDAETERAALEAMAEVEEEALALELVEAEVAREAESSRRGAVADALEALGTERFEAVPMSAVRLAIEQLTLDIKAPITSSPKRYALRRQLQALGAAHRRRAKEDETQATIKREMAKRQAMYARMERRRRASAAHAKEANDGDDAVVESAEAVEADGASPVSDYASAMSDPGTTIDVSDEVEAATPAVATAQRREVSIFGRQSTRHYLLTGQWLPDEQTRPTQEAPRTAAVPASARKQLVPPVPPRFAGSSKAFAVPPTAAHAEAVAAVTTPAPRTTAELLGNAASVRSSVLASGASGWAFGSSGGARLRRSSSMPRASSKTRRQSDAAAAAAGNVRRMLAPAHVVIDASRMHQGHEPSATWLLPALPHTPPAPPGMTPPKHKSPHQSTPAPTSAASHAAANRTGRVPASAVSTPGSRIPRPARLSLGGATPRPSRGSGL